MNSGARIVSLLVATWATLWASSAGADPAELRKLADAAGFAHDSVTAGRRQVRASRLL